MRRHSALLLTQIGLWLVAVVCDGCARSHDYHPRDGKPGLRDGGPRDGGTDAPQRDAPRPDQSQGPLDAVAHDSSVPRALEYRSPGRYLLPIVASCPDATIELWGAGGGAGGSTVAFAGGDGGGGAYVSVRLALTAGSLLDISVGGGGESGRSALTAGYCQTGGGGGGGATTLKLDTQLVAIAGGGAGGGGATTDAAGFLGGAGLTGGSLESTTDGASAPNGNGGDAARSGGGTGGYGLPAGGTGGSGGTDIYTRIRYSGGGGGGGGAAGGVFGGAGSCDPPATPATGGQGGKSRFIGAGVSAVILRGSGRMPGRAEASDGAGMGAAGADRAAGGTDGRVVVRLCSDRNPS